MREEERREVVAVAGGLVPLASAAGNGNERKADGLGDLKSSPERACKLSLSLYIIKYVKYRSYQHRPIPKAKASHIREQQNVAW